MATRQQEEPWQEWPWFVQPKVSVVVIKEVIMMKFPWPGKVLRCRIPKKCELRNCGLLAE